MAFSKNRRLAQIISDINGNISVQGITVPTQSASDNDTSAASTAYVTTAVSGLIDSAPDTLNTLNEIAAALNDDANFNTTISNSIAAKLALSGGTLTGALTTNGVINTGTSHNFAINTPNSLRINIDSNGSATDQVFAIGHNQTGVDVSNNVLMMMNESGNMAIGHGTPSHRLHIQGTNNDEARVRIHNSASGQASLDLDNSEGYYRTFTDAGEYRIYDQTDGAFRMRIDTSGKVAIGAHSPAKTLHVNSGTDNVVARLESSDSIAAVEFKDSGGSAEIGCNSSDLVLFPAGAEKARLTQGGNFGIGTSSPSAKCHLYTAGSEAINLGIQNSQRYWKIETVSEKLNIADVSAGGTVRMAFDTAGNVGIGTTSPSRQLTVQNSSDHAIIGAVSGTSNLAGMVMGDTSDDDRGAVLYNNNGDYMYFQTDTSERMRITSAGAVLIGQTSQTGYAFAQQLVVGGGTGNNNQGITIQSAQNSQGNLAFNRDNGTTAYGRISYQHGTNYMNFMTNNAERMRIDTNGKVAIGQSDASNANLVINGTVGSASDHPMIDFDGYGSRVDGASQSINFRMGRTGQATDQGAQIRSIFQGGGATAGQTAIGFEFRPINGNVIGTTVRFSGTGQRIQFWSDELPHSNNPITNQAFVIGPSSSGAITSGLTNSTVLLNRGGELYAIDSSHNNTQITPHNWGLISSGPSEELAWTYYSQRPNPNNNEEIQTINVDMAKVIRKVEDLVGEKLIYTENSDKDSHTFKNVIADIQTALADLTTRIETLEG